MYSFPVLGALSVFLAQFLSLQTEKKFLKTEYITENIKTRLWTRILQIDGEHIFYLKHTFILQYSSTEISQQAPRQLFPVLGNETARTRGHP